MISPSTTAAGAGANSPASTELSTAGTAASSPRTNEPPTQTPAAATHGRNLKVRRFFTETSRGEKDRINVSRNPRRDSGPGPTDVAPPHRNPSRSRPASQARAWSLPVRQLAMTGRACAAGKLFSEDRALPTGKLSQPVNRSTIPVVPVLWPRWRTKPRRRTKPLAGDSCRPSVPLRSRFQGSCRTAGRRVSPGSHGWGRRRQGRGARSWAQHTPNAARADRSVRDVHPVTGHTGAVLLDGHIVDPQIVEPGLELVV